MFAFNIFDVEFEYLTNIELEAMNFSEKWKLYIKVFIVLFINGKVNIGVLYVGEDLGVKSVAIPIYSWIDYRLEDIKK